MSEHLDVGRVTRIQLHTDLGRYEFWADRWEAHVQDDDMTLYLRGRGEGRQARTQRDLALAGDLADALPANREDDE